MPLLVADVCARAGSSAAPVIEGRFDVNRQWELARDLMDLEGLDPKVMFLTHTEHPYSDAMTTQLRGHRRPRHEEDVISNVYSMLHEGGHALYEQGVNPDFNYTSLKGGTSMGMHEAQSRFFENYVGRVATAFAAAAQPHEAALPRPDGRRHAQPALHRRQPR